MKIAIPYARNRIAYSILRSLSAAGHECTVADSTRLSMCRFSKYGDEFMLHPNPTKRPAEFAGWCVRMQHEGFTVFPTFMESWVLRRCGHLENALPPYNTIMLANNKWEVHKLCRELSIPTPDSQLVYNSVIKPLDARGSKGRIYVDGAVLQERIHGDAIGVGMLFNKGELKAKFAWRRLQEYPKDGGMSVVRGSVHASEQCFYAEKLLKALNWHGVAMVEFKGQHVIEVNPRFWGSIQLAVDSGVDFPNLLLDIMTKGDCETVVDWKRGVKTSWLAGCLKRRCRPRGNVEDFSLHDPAPFFTQFLLPLSNMLRGNGLVLDEN